MRILNVLWAADRACEEPTIGNMEALRWALDALPEGWQALIEEEVQE